MLLILAFAFAG